MNAIVQTAPASAFGAFDKFLRQRVLQRLSALGHGHLLVNDALGSAETCRNAILSLRKRGRHVQVGLLGAEGGQAMAPIGRIIAHELEILGSHGMQAHQYPRLLGMMAAGRLQPGRLVQRTISLEEAPEALEAMGRFAQPGVTVIDRF